MQRRRIMPHLARTVRRGALAIIAGLGAGLFTTAASAETVNFGGKVNFGSTAETPTPTEDSPAAELHAARQRLNQVRRSHWSELQENGEYRSAKDQLVAARAELESARQSTLHDLYQSSEYRTLRATLAEKEQQLEALRAKPEVDSRRIFQAATQLLQYRIALSQAEARACAAEPRIETARQTLVNAYATISRLRTDHAAALRNDPQWTSAREQLASARQHAYHAPSASTPSRNSTFFTVGVIGSRQLTLHWSR